MKFNTKNILLVALFAIGLVGAFIGGSFFGINFAYKLYKPTYEKELCIRAIQDQITIEQIDKDKPLESHKSIAIRLDGDIIAISLLLEEEADEGLKTKMQGLLRRIANHRMQFPNYYNDFERNTPELKEVNSKVEKILEKYRS